MQFTKLRIQGFKTFVDPTEVYIRDGLSGVVGPNGCGKSNLVEAMRWVMGENSFKNMRASGMDDVIFSGSGTRPSRNHAEVILTIDNSKRLAPALFNDADILEISRKIEREAGSTYKINGREVRARDVQLLFADASTGSRSPALVRQGQIGEIINAKPQSRRRILEEAAGISGLYARRHEAEMRLKAAEANFERLEDVFAGLQTQVDSLKKQAKGALKYREYSENIKRLEAMQAHIIFMEVLTQLIDAEKSLEVERLTVATATSKQAEAAKNQAIAATRLPQVRELAARAGAALNRMIVARDQLESEEKRAVSRTKELQGLVVQIERDMARETSQNSDAESVMAGLNLEKSRLEQELIDLKVALTRHETRLKEAEIEAKTSESSSNEATTLLAEATARRNALDRGLREANDRFTFQERQITSLEIEIAKLTPEPDKSPELTASLEAALSRQKLLESEMLSAEEAIKKARLGFEETAKPLKEAERKAMTLEAEASSLKKLLAPQNKKYTPILEQITVQKGYEKALAAALGEELEASTDPSSPMQWRELSKLSVMENALSNFVTAPNALARRLNYIGIVSKGEGDTLQKTLNPGERLVSLEGDLWRWDGFKATSTSQSSAARRMAEKNRLEEVIVEAEKAKEVFINHKKSSEIAEQTLKLLAVNEQKTRDSWRFIGREVDQARDKLLASERSSSQYHIKLNSLSDTKTRLTHSLDEAKYSLLKAQEALNDAPKTAPLELDLQEKRTEFTQKRMAVNEINTAFEGVKRDLQVRQSRILSIVNEQASWKKRLENANEQMKALQDRLKTASKEIKELEDAPSFYAQKRRTLSSNISDSEKERKQASDNLVLAERHMMEADREASETLKQFSSMRENFARLDGKIEALRLRKSELDASIEKQFQCAPQGLLSLTGLDRLAATPLLKTVENQLDSALKDRDRLGGVNLRADIELTESEAHLNKLISDRDELIEAVKKLRSAINSLNREGRERLLASFETVNANFKRIFMQLFGGGTAELQLIESDDPLEAGLDILAMPPGKKPQTMMLLSGGEQALTAISLIFAVFLTNPAPICVLDEVDAPLDDANVERYCDLLDEMAIETKTRFLVITHNPITMSRMDRLYGVTMAERGVSQLVSVDLQRAELLMAAE